MDGKKIFMASSTLHPLAFLKIKGCLYVLLSDMEKKTFKYTDEFSTRQPKRFSLGLLASHASTHRNTSA